MGGVGRVELKELKELRVEAKGGVEGWSRRVELRGAVKPGAGVHHDR